MKIPSGNILPAAIGAPPTESTAAPADEAIERPAQAAIAASSPSVGPTVADLRERHILLGGNAGVFDAVVHALDLGHGPLAAAAEETLRSALATAATAMSGFNASGELLLSAGSRAPQTGLFRECAAAQGVDPSALSKQDRKAIDDKFSAGMLAAARQDGFVELALAERLMRAAITAVTGRGEG